MPSDLWITFADRSILRQFHLGSFVGEQETFHGYFGEVSGVCYTVINWMLFALPSCLSSRFQEKRKVISVKDQV